MRAADDGGPIVLTGREAIEETERRICGAPPSASPPSAEGIAAAGADAASCGPVPPGPPPPAPLPASCVHHFFGGDGRFAGHDDVVLAPASAQEAVDLALAARAVARRIRRPVGCRHGAYGDAVAAVSLPPRSLLVGDAGATDGLWEPGAAAERIVQLAAHAAAAVAAGTGRPLDLVERTGPAGAPLVLAGAGPAGAAAQRLAAALTGAGRSCAAVAVRLVRPAPRAALAEALAGAARVVVLRSDDGRHLLRAAAVREAAPEAEVASVGVVSGASVAELAEAVAPVAGGPLPTLSDEAAGDSFRVAVVPAGRWAQGVARALAADRVAPGLGPAVEAVGGEGDAVVITGPAAAPAPDVLVAAGPRFLDAAGPLATMGAGGVVIVCAEAGRVEPVVAAIDPAARALLWDRELTVTWLRVGADEAADVITRRLRAACDGDAEGEGSSPGTPIPGALLGRDEAPPEIDFRGGAGLPRRAAAPEGDDAAPEHSPAAVRRFHMRGRAAPARPTAPFTPLAARAVAAAMTRRWPAALVRRDPGAQPSVETLEEALATALEAITPASRAIPERLDLLAREVRRAPGPDGDGAGDDGDGDGERGDGDGGRGDSDGTLAAAVAAAADGFVTALDLPEDEADAVLGDVAALVSALPPGSVLVRLSADAPVRIAAAALAASSELARGRLEARAREVLEQLEDRLTLDRLRSDEGRSPDALGRSLGGMAGIDPTRLSSTLPAAAAGDALPPVRRERLEDAAAVLASWLAEAADRPSVFVLAPPDGPPEAPDGADVLLHDEPLAASRGVFAAHARRLSKVVRALRTAELELADEWRADVHADALATLGWEGLTTDEVAAAPAVLVVVSAAHVRGPGATGLERILRSGEPVRVLVLDDGTEPVGDFHGRTSWRGVASREAVVVGGSVARPARFAEGVAAAAGAPRPALLEVAIPGPGPTEWRELRAELGLQGRSAPELRYLPDAGPDLADRVDGGGNPAPAAAWPAASIELRDGDPLELAVTHADALCMDPAWRDHFALARREDEAADQLPVAEWLERLGPDPEPWIPFVHVIDDDGVVRRAVLTRELGLACADRLRAWRVLQDAAGFDNAWARRAAAEASEAASAAADERLAEAAARHAAELEEARTETAREAFAELARALLDAGSGPLTLGTPRTPAPAAASEAAPSPAVDSPTSPPGGDDGVPVNGGGPPSVPTPAPSPEPAVSFEEAWIESELCTTCNACTNLNGRLFKYNGDKQAYIADLAAGTFEEMVRAAELCPAKCIHPGAPRAGDASATPDLVARAAPFN